MPSLPSSLPLPLSLPLQVFAETGTLLMDTAPFLTKFLRDARSEQRGDGMVTNNVPNAFEHMVGGARKSV